MDNTQRYTDWKKIAQGAFGEVCQAYDNVLQRPVAIKLLKNEHSNRPELVEGLYKEVSISRDLHHRNICAIYDIYEGSRGIGIVMELITGQPLSDWCKKNQDRLLESAPERLTIIKKVTTTIAHAHEHIVHRDLKPDNIFLRDGDLDHPVIMDFGTSVLGMRSDGVVAGTPKYMSPEQWEAPEKVNTTSDIFALGTIFYELFTNMMPPTSLRRVVRTKTPPRIPMGEIPLPSSFCAAVPASLDQLILQMLSYDQRDRPQTATEVSNVLEQVTLRSLEERGALSTDYANQAILIPSGRFFFGKSDRDAPEDVRPHRSVTMEEFKMGGFPVTNAEYRQFLDSTGSLRPPLIDDQEFGAFDNPVVGVTWEEALAYASWVGGYLPTEAQWEYAAKGGKVGIEYPWGNEPPTPTRTNLGFCTKMTSSRGSYPRGINALGLEDMAGNIWEWCRDWYDPNYYQSLQKKGTADPINMSLSDHKVMRGGAYNAFYEQGTCYFRSHADPKVRRPDIGFRVVYPANPDTEVERFVKFHIIYEKDKEELLTKNVRVGEFILGRSKGFKGAIENRLVIKDKTVSRRHCRLFLNKDIWFVEDTGSRYGTLLDGVLIEKPTPLNQGSVVTIGSTKINISFHDHGDDIVE